MQPAGALLASSWPFQARDTANGVVRDGQEVSSLNRSLYYLTNAKQAGISSCNTFFFFYYYYFFYCSGFCHTLKWNSHEFTCTCNTFLIFPKSHWRSLARSTLLQQTWTNLCLFILGGHVWFFSQPLTHWHSFPALDPVVLHPSQATLSDTTSTRQRSLYWVVSIWSVENAASFALTNNGSAAALTRQLGPFSATQALSWSLSPPSEWMEQESSLVSQCLLAPDKVHQGLKVVLLKPFLTSKLRNSGLKDNKPYTWTSNPKRNHRGSQQLWLSPKKTLHKWLLLCSSLYFW